MDEIEEQPYVVWFSRNDDRIHVQLDASRLSIQQAVFLHHVLGLAIEDYHRAVGR